MSGTLQIRFKVLPVRSSDGSRVNEPLSFVFINFILVCVTSDQNVDIHLPLNHRQTVRVTPRDNLMAVNEANLELTYLNDFRFRERLVFVEIATHNVDVRSKGLQLIVLFLRHQVTSTQHICKKSIRNGEWRFKARIEMLMPIKTRTLHFVGHQHTLEFFGDFHRPVRNMEITHNQRKFTEVRHSFLSDIDYEKGG